MDADLLETERADTLDGDTHGIVIKEAISVQENVFKHVEDVVVSLNGGGEGVINVNGSSSGQPDACSNGATDFDHKSSTSIDETMEAHVITASQDDVNRMERTSSAAIGTVVVELPTENSMLPEGNNSVDGIAKMIDDSSADDKRNGSDAMLTEEGKSDSKILKGILESNVPTYTSDLSNKDNLTKENNLNIGESLESQTNLKCADRSEEGESCTEKLKEVPASANGIDGTDKSNCDRNEQNETRADVKDEHNEIRADVKNEQNETKTDIKDDSKSNGDITGQNDTKSMAADRGKLDCDDKCGDLVNDIPKCAQPLCDTGEKSSENKPSASNSLEAEKPTDGKDVKANLVVDNSNNEERSTDDKPSDKPVKYRCLKCSCVTKDKRLYDNHSCDKEIGPDEDKVKITIAVDKEKNSYVCNECNFSSTGHGFEEHLMCHLMLRPYQCLYCKECFINRREISRHVIKSHNGAKMSCALRALRRAKGLIKEVTAAGSLTFMARVAGKVPLEKDPEKKKIGASESTKAQESPPKSPNPAVSQDDHVKDTEKDDGSAHGQKIDSPKDKIEESNDDNEKDSEAKQSDSSAPFSKLREVLTAENPLKLVQDQDSGEKILANNSANEDKKAPEEQGLKIIASYSLNEESEPPSHDGSKERDDRKKSEKSSQPNFFTASPPSTPEPELVSFLGPECPVVKQSVVPSPRLSPPSVKPPHSTSTSLSVNSSQPPSMPATKAEKITSFFICSFNCTFHTISKSDFLSHMIDFHSNEKSFTCYYCGYKSSRSEDVVNHTSTHADSVDKKATLFKCSISDCQFGSNMITDFINHVNTTHKDGNRPACNSCVSVFQEASMLQTHLEENIIHIVNCPHCPSKATDRRTILNHISSEHPGKPKMVSVAKQLICRDRKMNGYEHAQPTKEMLPPSITPSPSHGSSNCSQGSSVLDQILRRQDQRGIYPGSQSSSTALDVVTGSTTSTSPRNTPSPASQGMSPFSSRKRDDTPESERSPASELSGFSGVRVKEEIEETNFDDFKEPDTSTENNTSYVIDEHGIRRRLYVPMSERHAENFCCRYCTFVARDLKRLACHERSHGMPPTRKDRFKCMFCPQGFDSEMKFRLHITCHPGLIKFLLYKCRKCEFDSNQKHTIVKHITCNRDRKHRGVGPVEDHYTIISRSLESRVLECEQCDYMTRHKVHMAIHYQREHGILRDKSDFTIEGLTPSDTPVTSQELSQYGIVSPQNEASPSFDFSKSAPPPNKRRKDSGSSDTPNLSVGEIYQRNELFTRLVSQQAALQPGHVLENQARKFKCPICKYLLPKAADLKNHVKRHSEIGQITLVMFRCKYCSCMSTARELLYGHLKEKHPGKSIALVKKIVAIDTTETDKSFAETSVEESLQQLEASVHNEIMSAINNSQSQTIPSTSQPSLPSRSFDQLFVVPQGGETLPEALQCPKCSHSSHHRDEMIQHVTGKHPEVKVIFSDDDVNDFGTSTSSDHNQLALGNMPSPPSSQEEVLIVPDEPVFKEMALCSRCDFSTVLRKDMVFHLQQNHPEISVMGRNSYPVQVSTMGSKLGENVLEESCVVGSGSLDTKLRCLYENYGSQMKCLICGIERPKKFFIHVHILRHLNIYLWKCTFCSHRGLQKYKMVDHIKKIHPGQPMSVRYLRVNVESRVAQFMAQFNASQNQVSTPDPVENESVDQFPDLVNEDTKRVGTSIDGTTHVLGGDDLDMKINCLYDYNDGLFYKCLACNNQFQRKFAIHRHIIISHLKVALLSCAYCGMQGVEKHQMVDHILACHQTQPVSFHTNDVDIVQAVSKFLAKSAHGNGCGEDSNQRDGSSEDTTAHAEDYYKRMLSGKKSKVMNLGQNFKFPLGAKLKGMGLIGKKKTTGNKSKTIVDPGVIMLGREALDKELCSLYQVRPGGHLRCLICRWEFPRKYPLHRHIMLKHLRMNLVACPYCSYNGVEKYTVSTHIKEEHKDQPINIRYIQPDVKMRVHQFLNEMTSGSTKIKKRMSYSTTEPTTLPSLSMLVKMKREKNTEFDNDDEDEDGQEEEEAGRENDDNDDDDDDDDKKERSSPPANQGLVVAMFGKKSQKTPQVDDVVIKKEMEDGDFEDATKTEQTSSNGHNDEDDNEEDEEEEEEEEDEENALGEGTSHFDGATSQDQDMRNKFLFKFKKNMDSYAPGQYRSPSGGKPKALDVITKIKVLKSREGSITKFYCEKCNFTSIHRSNIVRHIYKIHERYQTHTCPVCHYQTLSLMLMQTHMNKEHPGTEYTEDSFTLHPPHTKPRSRSILGKYQHKRRKQKSKGFTDLIIPTPPIPSASAISTTTSGSLGPKQFACAYCHYETNTQDDILEHTRERHSQDFSATDKKSSRGSKKSSEDKSKACWERSKKAVKRKMATEGSPEKPMPRVKRKFVFEKGDELIQCGHCDVRETSMGRMQHHTEWEHPGLPLEFKRIPAWRFVCKTCAVKTMATSKMKYHLNRHVSYRPYTCINCGAFFPSPDQCRRHARSNRHEEQYMYVRNAKKEQRVEELLQETRQLALRIQEEAFNDPDFNIANIDAFMSRYQNTKHNLKRTGGASGSPKASKKAKHEAKAVPVRKQFGKSPQTVGIELNVTIKCFHCDFQDNTIHQVSMHHKTEHPGERFLWTELDRGFTCDRTGEAVQDCDSLPTSGDVGYSTKISIGHGSNSTRFKCKSCEFSSGVIQAMKSHLKSHQPKGYVCPYCSRFFSGKEKLMRHQYCLHKDMPNWVVHLRKSNASKQGSVAQPVPSPAKRSLRDTSKEKDSVTEEDDASAVEIDSRPASQLRYACNDCSFTSDNLLQYRQHLSKAHAAFRQRVREDSSSVVDNSEGEESTQSSNANIPKEANFQCGHCNFQSSEVNEVEEHQEELHTGDERQVLDLRSQEEEEEPAVVTKPLLNLEPRVTMKRISTSTIAWYDDSRSAHSDNESYNDNGGENALVMDNINGENSMNDPLESNSVTDYDTNAQMAVESDREISEEDNEGSFTEEGVSHLGALEEEEEVEYEHGDDDDDEIIDESVENREISNLSEDEEIGELADEEREEDEEKEIEDFNGSEYDYDENAGGGNDPDDLASRLGLVGDSSTSKSDDMMILKFDGIKRNPTLSQSLQDDLADDKDSDDIGGTFGSDEEDDEDDDEFDESSVTLASPLPMISLGDGVNISPDIFGSNSGVRSNEDQDNSNHSTDSKALLDF